MKEHQTTVVPSSSSGGRISVPGTAYGKPWMLGTICVQGFGPVVAFAGLISDEFPVRETC